MLRVLGLLFIGLAATAVALDATGREEGAPFGFSSIGDFWFALHRESLIGLQSGIENRVDPGLWAAVSPALHWPAAPVLGGIGLGFLALGMVMKIRAAEKRAKRI